MSDWDGHKRNLAVLIRAQQIPCPDHPMPLPKPSCWQCGRNGAFERAARLVEGGFVALTPPPGTVIPVEPAVDVAAVAHAAHVTHQLIYGETLYRDQDGVLQKVIWDIGPTGVVVADEGWEPVIDDAKLTGFKAVVEKSRCAQCRKPGRLCGCSGGPWPDFARPPAVILCPASGTRSCSKTSCRCCRCGWRRSPVPT